MGRKPVIGVVVAALVVGASHSRNRGERLYRSSDGEGAVHELQHAVTAKLR
jgi:hypothetical protein